MASVAFVTTEHDEAGPSPAKLPQPPGYFFAHDEVIGQVVGTGRQLKLTR
jgi:hypothetical protein